MKRCFEYRITDEDLPVNTGEYLRKKGFSRQTLVHLKKTEQGILVNGAWAYVRTPLHVGDRLHITLTEEASSAHIVPVQMELSIVYEDEDLLLVNKPCDMPVHPSVHNYDNTLANGIAHYYESQGETFVFRCINRLDRDTTGLLILAKNAFSASVLSQQMKQRKIRRIYLAAVSGVPVPAAASVCAPIARKDGSAIERCVDFEKGETAVTHYKTLKSFENHTLLELSLETGRTHQIRVHMQYLGFPLLGDYLYNPDFSLIKRVALHSSSLSFCHPATGKQMYFSVPLPEDMAALFPDK